MFSKLESLRGVAACLIVLFHSPFNYGEEPLAFIRNSYLFVDFFFIISGFVISYAYGEKIEEGMSFKDYTFLRLGRIYPLHLFLLLIWIPYILVKQYLYNSGFGGTDPSEASNISSFISNLLLVHSMGIHSYLSWNVPSWSISVEFFAYIFFYALLITIDRRENLILPLVVSFLCYVVLFSLGRNNLDITFDYGFIRCLGAFYLGVFLFRFRTLGKININSNRLISLYEIISVLLVVSSVICSSTGNIYIGLSIFSFFAAVAVFSSSKIGVVGKLLELKFMREIGVRSYSIYMVHFIILACISNISKYIFKIDLGSSFGALSFVINIFLVTITIMTSKYTYLHIEKRFRDLVKSKVNKHSY